MRVTYTAVLDVSEDSVLFLSGLLHAERIRRGTRADTRSLGTYKQAVPALRWLFDDTRISQLARDNGIAVSTAYEYRDEAITVLAARKPSLRGALLAANATGHTHVILDGTLIPTDRICTPGPTRGVDLWWSGKHRHHGGNVQEVSAPDGWPLWTSGVRPGREHDTTAARADPDLLTQLADWVDDGQLGLGDLGYEGKADLLRISIKKPPGGELTVDQQAYNAVRGALRCRGRRWPTSSTTAPPCSTSWTVPDPSGCPHRGANAEQVHAVLTERHPDDGELGPVITADDPVTARWTTPCGRAVTGSRQAGGRGAARRGRASAGRARRGSMPGRTPAPCARGPRRRRGWPAGAGARRPAREARGRRATAGSSTLLFPRARRDGHARGKRARTVSPGPERAATGRAAS